MSSTEYKFILNLYIYTKFIACYKLKIQGKNKSVLENRWRIWKNTLTYILSIVIFVILHDNLILYPLYLFFSVNYYKVFNKPIIYHKFIQLFFGGKEIFKPENYLINVKFNSYLVILLFFIIYLCEY